MAKDGVHIPVDVTGSEKAKAELRGVGDAARGVEGAANQGATGQQNFNEQTKKGGELFEDYDRKAEKLVKQTLGLVNPQFAQMADLLFDVNDGVLKVTRGMLGFAAAGVGIGLIVNAIQSMISAIERAKKELAELQERERDSRKEGLDTQTDVLDRMQAGGVKADAMESVALQAIGFMRPDSSVPVKSRKQAIDLAVLAARDPSLTKNDLATVAAGMFASGDEQIDFDKKGSVEELMKRGGERDRMDAARADARARQEQLVRDAIPLSTLNRDPRAGMADALVDNLAGTRPDLNKESIERIRQVAHGKALEPWQRERAFETPDTAGQRLNDALWELITVGQGDTATFNTQPDRLREDISLGTDIFDRVQRMRTPRSGLGQGASTFNVHIENTGVKQVSGERKPTYNPDMELNAP